MEILIVENDYSQQRKMKKLFSVFGNCDVVINGIDAVEAYKTSWIKCKPYNLICMGMIIPGPDRQHTTLKLREIEKELGIEASEGVRVITTSALNNSDTITIQSHEEGHTACQFDTANMNEHPDNTCVLGIC